MDEESGTNKSEKDTGVENEDAKAIKELLSVASHERKNLQLLVEYFEKKVPELDERKQFFDRISSQVPDSLQKLDFVSNQIEEIKARLWDYIPYYFKGPNKELGNEEKDIKQDSKWSPDIPGYGPKIPE